MNQEHRSTKSVWMDHPVASPTEPPRRDLACDVCIVGAGIAGLSVAYHLAREGKSVIVLDDGPIGGGETGRTTAHLSNAIDDRYYEMERFHGEEGARLIAGSHTAAVDRIEQIVSDEKIACDFSRLDGFLFLPPNGDVGLIERELAAAHRAGLSDVSRAERAPIASFDTGPCLRFPRQGQFHVLKYLDGLAGAIRRLGGQIVTRAHVVTVKGGDPAVLRTADGWTVTAGAAVVATNSPINDRFSMHTKQSAYRTYAVAAVVPPGAGITPALYWDGYWEGDTPYHYVRLQPGSADAGSPQEDLLIVGGEDHKTGQADDAQERYQRLEAWTRERFPMIAEIAFRWSGQVMETMDGIAYIGRNPADDPNVYLATGDSGLGMTHGTLAGMLISDLILGRVNPWTELYDPSRRTLKAVREFVRENVNVVAQYTDWVTGSDAPEVAAIAPGSGAVIRRGLKKVAVSRALDGTLHERSAVCPHLGCLVRWNSLESSWDCPCHGSRFDVTGCVLNGPAVSPLASVGE